MPPTFDICALKYTFNNLLDFSLAFLMHCMPNMCMISFDDIKYTMLQDIFYLVCYTAIPRWPSKRMYLQFFYLYV